MNRQYWNVLKVRLADHVVIGRWQYTFSFPENAQGQADVLNTNVATWAAHKGVTVDYAWRAVEVSA